MKKTLPSSTKVVVIGGGVAGCSVAYHLAKYGWKDTILLERDQLTSGTTWHAAGLLGQLGATATITKLRKYSLNLYKELEKKTELSTGLKQNGAITVASSQQRLQELLRQATAAQLFDVNVEVLDKHQIKNLYPVINDKDIFKIAKNCMFFFRKFRYEILYRLREFHCISRETAIVMNPTNYQIIC